MGAWGAERIISALCALPRVRARAYLSILPMELKKQCEREILRRYITDGIQMITQNTAGRDEQLYLSIGYEDIISPKPVENRSAEWNAENGEATAYTIDNLADCQAALVDYIEMQGLAGYAANEAAGTIEGSTASMKAAWQNLATGMADSNADMEGLTKDFVDSVFTAGKNIIPRVQQIVTGVGTATVEAISYLRETNSAIDLLVTAFEFAATAATVAGTAIGASMAGKAIANIATIFTANASALAFFTAESGKAAVAEATLNGVFSVSEIAVGVLTGQISLATAAQYAWNTAINANPIGLIAAAVAALAIGIGKATKAHKDFVKELAGEPQTVEEARAKVEELEQQYEEASKARLEAFSSDAGFSGDTVEMERLAEAIKQAKQNLADLEAQEQAAAEEAAKPANVIKAASEEYAAAAQSILEDYQNTYTTIPVLSVTPPPPRG